jgi:hypothetical protein
MWADSLYLLHGMFSAICKFFTSFQHILQPSLYARWVNFDSSSRPWVSLHLCSIICTSNVCLFQWCNICYNHMHHCTHCFIYWASLTRSVVISVSWSVCLVSNMVLTLKESPMCLSFLQILLTYGIITVPWYIASEGVTSQLFHYRVNNL